MQLFYCSFHEAVEAGGKYVMLGLLQYCGPLLETQDAICTCMYRRQKRPCSISREVHKVTLGSTKMLVVGRCDQLRGDEPS